MGPDLDVCRRLIKEKPANSLGDKCLYVHRRTYQDESSRGVSTKSTPLCCETTVVGVNRVRKGDSLMIYKLWLLQGYLRWRGILSNADSDMNRSSTISWICYSTYVERGPEGRHQVGRAHDVCRACLLAS